MQQGKRGKRARSLAAALASAMHPTPGMSSDDSDLDHDLLEHVAGGLRTSASSQAELIPLLKQTKNAVEDLARNQSNAGSSSQMLPLMMLMMRR